MKVIKTSIILIAIAAIVFFIWRWSQEKIASVNPTDAPLNTFIEEINDEIDSLKKMPKTVISHQMFSNIQFQIDDYHKQGFLGISYTKEGKEEKNKFYNDENYSILSNNLFTAYLFLFIDQAMQVFNGTEWRLEDLKTIRSEVNKLSRSPYLNKQSQPARKLGSISAILAKHDEILGFINKCNAFSYGDEELNNQFPDVSGMIEKTLSYQANNPALAKVKNCTRLKEGLQQIPAVLFDKHIVYLKRKMYRHLIRYTEFDTQKEYSNNIFDPIRKQLNNLENSYKDVYGISENMFYIKYREMESLLEDYDGVAFNYFRNR